MVDRSAREAWKLYVFNWGAIAAAGILLFAAASLAGFRFDGRSVWLGGGFVAVNAGFAWYNAKRRGRQDPQVVFVLGGFAQVVLVTLVMTPLIYTAAVPGLPLQDQALMALDSALGMDWQAYLTFVHARPLLATWLDFGYTMIKWPLFIVPVALAACGRYAQIQHFVLTFLLALFVTAVVSVFVPALGTYHQLGLSIRDFPLFSPSIYEGQLRDLPLVRDGSLRVIDLGALNGIVTFPSFHASSAVIYLWALWPVRLLRPIAVFANAMMMAATPLVGGHYFVDLIAGAAVALLAIVAAGTICRFVLRHRAFSPNLKAAWSEFCARCSRRRESSGAS